MADIVLINLRFIGIKLGCLALRYLDDLVETRV